MLFLFLNKHNYNVIYFYQVECYIFLDIDNLYLRTVNPNEPLVTNLIDKAKDVFHKNIVGPKK